MRLPSAPRPMPTPVSLLAYTTPRHENRETEAFPSLYEPQATVQAKSVCQKGKRAKPLESICPPPPRQVQLSPNTPAPHTAGLNPSAPRAPRHRACPGGAVANRLPAWPAPPHRRLRTPCLSCPLRSHPPAQASSGDHGTFRTRPKDARKSRRKQRHPTFPASCAAGHAYQKRNRPPQPLRTGTEFACGPRRSPLRAGAVSMPRPIDRGSGQRCRKGRGGSSGAA